MFLYRETVSQGFSNGMTGLYTAVQYCSMAGLYTAVQAVEQGEPNRNCDVHFPT